ncbi:hypothetical protein [Demequina pelophila]|uniref:hypothetical protein n=1 Tax=Demequina pelophila TaxID=1638984 RepID=UPI000785CD34|nr:hypothetical protein [Demequina pelophila]
MATPPENNDWTQAEIDARFSEIIAPLEGRWIARGGHESTPTSAPTAATARRDRRRRGPWRRPLMLAASALTVAGLTSVFMPPAQAAEIALDFPASTSVQQVSERHFEVADSFGEASVTLHRGAHATASRGPGDACDSVVEPVAVGGHLAERAVVDCPDGRIDRVVVTVGEDQLIATRAVGASEDLSAGDDAWLAWLAGLGLGTALEPEGL